VAITHCCRSLQVKGSGRLLEPHTVIRVGGAARGRTGTVPVFTDRRLSKEEPGYTPAASPRLRRRHSPWPPAPAVVTSAEVAHPTLRQARTAPSPDPPGSSWWDTLGGFTHRFLAYSFSSCSPGPPPSDGAGHAPALSGPLATLTGTSRIGRVGPADCSAGPPSELLGRLSPQAAQASREGGAGSKRWLLRWRVRSSLRQEACTRRVWSPSGGPGLPWWMR
jgi:hypothetical protein